MQTKEKTKLEIILFQKGLSQVQVATATGIYNTLFNMIVKGHRKPNTNQKRKICNYLKMSITEVFGKDKKK